MCAGLCTLELRLNWANSLKEKRREIKSLIGKVRNKFNVSIAEVYFQDDWKRAGIGIAAVSSEKRHIEIVLNRVINFIECNFESEIIYCKTEII